MGEILQHPACVRAFRAPLPPDRPNVRLFEDDGHIRPMIDIEADLIDLALRVNGGSLGKAARDLGVGRTTLYRRLLK
ncbi:helix-turn-helix domain-containing protein [Novosphingobium sp. G106]|nr:helix-turn-helix domain-containing protein [Novosphingobium sp. G106]